MAAKTNLVINKKKKNFVDVTTVLKNDALRAKLQNYIDEVVRCKIKILDENESIKALRESAVDELEIEPKMFNSLVSLFFNNNFEEKKEEVEKLEEVLTILTNQQIMLSGNVVED